MSKKLLITGGCGFIGLDNGFCGAIIK